MNPILVKQSMTKKLSVLGLLLSISVVTFILTWPGSSKDPYGHELTVRPLLSVLPKKSCDGVAPPRESSASGYLRGPELSFPSETPSGFDKQASCLQVGPADVTTRDFQEATLSSDDDTGVWLYFDDAGAKKFADMTASCQAETLECPNTFGIGAFVFALGSQIIGGVNLPSVNHIDSSNRILVDTDDEDLAREIVSRVNR